MIEIDEAELDRLKRIEGAARALQQHMLPEPRSGIERMVCDYDPENEALWVALGAWAPAGKVRL